MKVKCPYNQAVKTVTQSNNSVNDDQTNGYSVVTQTVSAEFGECFMDKCGAWDYNGKGCTFNTSVE